MKRLMLLAVLALVAGVANSQTAGTKLDPALFAKPPQEYRPVDCWWWDGGPLTREKIRWQIEDLHAKGVGGTWLYPRYGASQPMSAEPGFWTEGWWGFVDFSLREHERLGMTQWSNDWLGRLDKSYFQSLLRAERTERPELTGRRLVAHRVDSTKRQTLSIKLPAEDTVLVAAAYRSAAGGVDPATRVDLKDAVRNRELRWDAPAAGWVLIVIAQQPHDLDYLSPAVARRWIDIYFEEYRRRLGPHLGKSLTAYGPDERQVLNGNILFSDGLLARIKQTRGYDPTPDLAALFLDLGPRTDKIRCDYYGIMSALLEENLYAPIHDWLRNHGMKQATVATWGRQDILGQTSNYGDFFRMMKHFDTPGNEDSVESNPGAFLDAKLSSSIAHVHGNSRVAVCAYWGMGWGYTQNDCIARTNANYAYGTTLFNSHGVMYSLMGTRNEFVPPSVHFYQPYWQTWRTFTDYTSRLSYVLSRGRHRADVAILYPLTTLHANWHGGNKFDKPAREAQRSLFALADAVHARGLDFDFLDEESVARAAVAGGKLKPGSLEFSVVLLPAMTTLRTDVREKLEAFVKAGGTLIAFGELPTASPEQGRNDAAMTAAWRTLFEGPNSRAVLVRTDEADAAKAVLAAITPDVVCPEPDVIHTHQQAGDDHVYFIVNRQAKPRTLDVTVRCSGVPEIWDAHTGTIQPLHRFETLDGRTRLRLTMEPQAGVLVVIKPDDKRPRVVADSFAMITGVRKNGDGYDITGTNRGQSELAAKIVADGRIYEGRAKPPMQIPSVALDGMWECECLPTMNNRWGDFRHPAREEMIGPEAPVMKYRDEPAKRPDWHLADADDREWKDVKSTYGPSWRLLGPLDPDSAPVDVTEAARLPGWHEYSHSLSLGADRVDIHQQTYEGMTAVAPEFLAFDRPAGKAAVYFLSSRVYSPMEQSKHLAFGKPGDSLPRQAWLNGKLVADDKTPLREVVLRKGWNDIALRIAAPKAAARKGKAPVPPVATYLVFQPGAAAIERPRFMPLSPWAATSTELIFDCRPAGQTSVGWYRFRAPPGARTAKLVVDADSVEAWVGGQPVKVVSGVINMPNPAGPSALIALRVVHRPGCYEGAAISEPVSFECGRGQIALGDWCNSGLAHYSGGLRYTTTIRLTREQIAQHVRLDLGDVRVSAEVTVNGRPQGVRLAKPFALDITAALVPGDNVIQVDVLNTLANFMSTTPTKYVFAGQTVSGLLGPVQLQFSPQSVLHCRAVR